MAGPASSPDGAQGFGFWPFEDFTLWGKNSVPEGLHSGLFQNLMINSAYVRTALVLSSDCDPNRVPRKYTRTESSSRVHVCCPGGSPAWLPRHPRPLWLVYPANTRHCGKYVAWRGAAGPALGGCTVSWELTKTPQKAGGNPFMQQSPKDPQARFSAWPTRG